MNTNDWALTDEPLGAHRSLLVTETRAEAERRAAEKL